MKKLILDIKTLARQLKDKGGLRQVKNDDDEHKVKAIREIVDAVKVEENLEKITLPVKREVIVILDSDSNEPSSFPHSKKSKTQTACTSARPSTLHVKKAKRGSVTDDRSVINNSKFNLYLK